MLNTKSNFRINLLAAPPAQKMVRSFFFPYALQLGALLVFAFLLVNGMRTGSPESYGTNLTATIRKTNLTTLVVWGMWWPGLILATIVLGRVWCTVCPMELVSNVANRVAKTFGFKGWALPRWMRWGFLALLAYVMLQLLVAGFEVHRTPLYTSFVLFGLLALALLAGAMFREPRAFCQSFCPASLLLSVYSRLSRVGLRKAQDEVCAQCQTKDCVRADNRFKIDARSCPSYLRPYDLNKCEACVLCFQCAKVCPHDNVGFGLVQPELKGATVKTLPTAAAIFIFIAGGFVSHELFGEAPVLDNFFHYAPEKLAAFFGQPALFPWLEALWFLVILPAVILGCMWLISRSSKAPHAFAPFITTTALFLVPVLAAGHAMKALIKLNSWSVYLPPALHDPTGITLAQSLVAGNAKALAPLFSTAVIGWLMAILLATSFIFAGKKIYEKLDAALRPAAYGGIGILTCLYASVVLNWLTK